MTETFYDHSRERRNLLLRGLVGPYEREYHETAEFYHWCNGMVDLMVMGADMAASGMRHLEDARRAFAQEVAMTPSPFRTITAAQARALLDHQKGDS